MRRGGLLLSLSTLAAVAASNSHDVLRSPFNAIHEERKRTAAANRRLAITGKIIGFSLIDAERGSKILDIVNGTVIDLNSLAGGPNSLLSINASFVGDIGSVKFGHNGNPNAHTENYAWYSFCGNSGPNFFACPALSTVGNHTVTATPYSDGFAGGDTGLSYTVSFSIVSSKVAVALFPTATPAPTAPTVQDKLKVPVAAVVPSPVAVPLPFQNDTSMFGNGTYFEPNLLDLIISLSTVNVTSGPVTVSIQAVLENDALGIAEVYMQATAPEFQYEASGSCIEPIVSSDGDTVACNVTLQLKPFIPEGNYSLQLSVYSRNYDYTVIPSHKLEERMLPHVIEVFNANGDDTPPVLLDFGLLTAATLNVTTEDAMVTVQIRVQDDLARFSFGYLEALDPEGFSSSTVAYFDPSVVPSNGSNGGKSLLFNVSLPFRNSNRPGDYPLLLSVYDNAGNSEMYDADALQEMGFVSSIKIVNSNFDGEPPQLLDFVVLSMTNATSQAKTVEMQLLVEDTLSGVQYVYLQVTRGSNVDSYTSFGASFNVDNPAAGAFPVNLTLTFPRYTRSGEYMLDLQISDARGNTASFNADQLANQSFPYFLDVINDMEDFTPPRLLDLVALTPTKVNVSSEQTLVTLQLVVQDDVSGIQEAHVSGHGQSRRSSYLYDDTYFGKNKSPVAGQPVTFNFSLGISQSTMPGNYSLEVTLYDAANNYAYFDSAQLKKLSMPYVIEVVNQQYDGTPPVLEDLVVLSASTVNVTLAPAVLEIQVVVNDAMSGFKHGVVELWSYALSAEHPIVALDSDAKDSMVEASSTKGPAAWWSTGAPMPVPEYYPEYNISFATFQADKKLVGESTVYNVSLPIPQYVKPGNYSLQVVLYDYAANMAYFDRRSMVQMELLHEIRVDNLLVDREHPELLDFVALTPLTVNLTSGPVTIEFQVTVQDALTGVSYGYVGASGPGNTYSYYNYSHTAFDVPVGGEPVVFNASITLDPLYLEGSAFKGSYNIELGLSDRVNQYVSLVSTDLIALGFPGTFVVV